MMATKFPPLNLPKANLRLRRNGADADVWDALRKKWLLLTPEEWVRRHMIAMLTDHYHIAPQLIIQEYQVMVNSQPQRADIVVVDANGTPRMVVECKAASVAICNSTLEQATRYNSIVKAEYVVLTNGINHYCYQVTEGHYTQLSTFPTL